MKKYKYVYKGTSGISVCGQVARKPGDIIEIPIKNYTHKKFVSKDGGKNYPKGIHKLAGVGSGIDCLLIGRGESSKKFDYKEIKGIRIAINPRIELLKKIDVDYIVYLENNYSDYINKHIKYFKDIAIIGNGLALNCEKVDYCYGRDDLIEGNSSGFYAVQIAQLMGFKNISLIGFDYSGKEYKKETFDLWLSDFDKIDMKGIKQLNKKSNLKEY